MTRLCERTCPNYVIFCKQTRSDDGRLYRCIPDLIWEALIIKGAKANFDSQLEKLEEAILATDDLGLYGVYPAIDACVVLSEPIRLRLSGKTLKHAIEVSKISITGAAMLEMTGAGRGMIDEELKANPMAEQERGIQWEAFRLLADCEERDLELVRGLCANLYEAGEDNIGISSQQ